MWVSGVDFSDLGDTTTTFEIDVYAGRNFDIGPMQLTLEGMYSSFPDKNIPGPTYDFVTVKGRLRRAVDALTCVSSIAWVPEASYGAGVAWRLTGDASYTWAKWLKTGGQIGHRWNERGANRTF